MKRFPGTGVFILSQDERQDVAECSHPLTARPQTGYVGYYKPKGTADGWVRSARNKSHAVLDAQLFNDRPIYKKERNKTAGRADVPQVPIGICYCLDRRYQYRHVLRTGSLPSPRWRL